MSLKKRKSIRSEAIRQAANGEACTICLAQDGTVVFCHLNESFAGKGLGLKADDIAGFFGCHGCHKQYDTQGSPIAEDHWTIMRAMYRTWVRLIEKGVITINRNRALKKKPTTTGEKT